VEGAKQRTGGGDLSVAPALKARRHPAWPVAEDVPSSSIAPEATRRAIEAALL
jgi:hypothetical protein